MRLRVLVFGWLALSAAACAATNDEAFVRGGGGAGAGGGGGDGGQDTGTSTGNQTGTATGTGTATDTATATQTDTGTGTGSSTGTAIWVNELHYDNDRVDTNEGIEIAGTAGLSLSGYSIALYNGSGGTQYDVIDLEGNIPNQQSGVGAVWFPRSLQNGPDDGFALVGPGGAVLQFLSYEGTVNAVDGSAVGLVSTSIGVEEVGTTPVGLSLQLSGTGNNYGQFSWAPPATASPGQINIAQTIN